MTLNLSGPISLGGATAGQSVNLELGLSATASISFNSAAVRTLTATTTGTVLTMPTNFYGKANRASVSYTFTTSTANAALNVNTISGYVSGKSDVTVTVNSGIYLWASTTGNYGLNLTGGTTGDTLTLVNNGYIIGCGGSGHWNTAAQAGGPALNVGIGRNITINNTNASAYIAGGGGSGGGGWGGGGAGGGSGACCSNPCLFLPGQAPGGAGGNIGASGGDGTGCFRVGGCCMGDFYWGVGGGGGRILPGTGGAGGLPVYGGYTTYGQGLGGGAGGGGGGGLSCYSPGGRINEPGGSGGSANAAGGAAYTCGYGGGTGGGGGGWGAAGGTGYANYGGNGGAGGAGGKAVNLNGKTVTWTSGNTTRVYGTVS